MIPAHLSEQLLDTPPAHLSAQRECVPAISCGSYRRSCPAQSGAVVVSIRRSGRLYRTAQPRLRRATLAVPVVLDGKNDARNLASLTAQRVQGSCRMGDSPRAHGTAPR
jgi:hypothetical protein